MIGVIGCGNMAQAIVKGYAKKNKDVKFLTFTPSYTRAKELADYVGGSAARELSELSCVDTIVIACKPQQLTSLAKSMEEAGLSLEDKHIISILAATPINTLKSKLQSRRVSRVMPNIPCLVGRGMSLVIHSNEVTRAEADLVDDFFISCGEVVSMPSELLFDQVTTVSGSGPAYVYLFAKTLADKLVSWGLDQEDAKKISIQLFSGSSEIMKSQNDRSLDELIASVTSKAGVTIEAVNSYKENNLEALSSMALDAAFNRSEEIREELNS